MTSAAYLVRIRRTLVAGSALWLAACATAPEDAGPVLARSAQLMGADRVATLRYVAEGMGYTFGQAFKPGGAWPKITLHSLTRSIDYGSASMRDEVVLSRAEPLGGGGYPLSGQQRVDQFISGEIAWNQSGATVTPGARFVGERLHQLWITPHGVLKAASRGGASARRGADGGTAVSFVYAGRFSATALIGADGLVRQVDSTVPDAVLGDTRVVTTYEDYRDVGAIKFPNRVHQSIAGFQVLDLVVKEVQANPAVSVAVPDAARDTSERVTVEKVSDGVWFLAGGSHNSVAIEMQDHLILVEAPLGDARTQAVIAQLKVLAPGKPIRSVVNSHSHFDHSSGLRAAVAEGATIVTQAQNVAYFEQVLSQPNAVRPDALARASRKPGFVPVSDKLELGDASRSVEVHRIVGGPHSDSFVMVYLPKDKLLIEADAFTPAALNTAPPAVPNANNVNLIDNIERLKLVVERILPLHGRVVPATELYSAVGRATPR